MWHLFHCFYTLVESYTDTRKLSWFLYSVANFFSSNQGSSFAVPLNFLFGILFFLTVLGSDWVHWERPMWILFFWWGWQESARCSVKSWSLYKPHDSAQEDYHVPIQTYLSMKPLRRRVRSSRWSFKDHNATGLSSCKVIQHLAVHHGWWI